MNLDFRIEPAHASKIAEAYTGDLGPLAPFFFGAPWDAEAIQAKAVEVSDRFSREDREQAARALHSSGQEADARIEQMIENDGFMVTTGQQAGLFTGPLYTIYKALAAIGLARTLESALDRPVLPVFWIASEDHDWAEIDHVVLVDTANELTRIQLEDGEPGRSPPVFRRTLGDGIETALDDLTQAVPETEFAPDLLDGLRDAYRAGRSPSDAFRAAMLDLFADLGLYMADAADPVIKEVSAPILRMEIEAPERQHDHVAERTAELEAAGFQGQVPVLDGASNVFLESEMDRERLFFGPDGWRARGSGTRFETAELLALHTSEPQRFSPNALVRPVVESAVFPTLAYVAGPAELGYFAQLGALFESHGIRMPLVWPRPSVTLIEAKVAKVLEKFELGPSEFARPSHELASEVFSDELPGAVSDAIDELRGALGRGYERLETAAREIDDTLRGPVGGARNNSFSELRSAEKAISRRFKAQNDIAVAQLEKAHVNLFPSGEPQERVLNAYPYLVRYGRPLLTEILNQMHLELGGDRASRPSVESTGAACGT